MKTNHSGVCLFYRTRYTVCRFKLPIHRSMELLAVHIQGASVNSTLVIVYRPGSLAVTLAFMEDFTVLIDRVAV